MAKKMYGISFQFSASNSAEFSIYPVITGVGYVCPDDPELMQAICDTCHRDRVTGKRIISVMTFRPDGIGRSYEEAYNKGYDVAYDRMCEWLDEEEE